MIQTRTQTHAGIATDPPGELAQRELVATDYHELAPVYPPVPPRHDRSAIAALALVSTMAIGVIGSLVIQSRSMPEPPPKPVAPPPVETVQPQPVEDEGLPLWALALGGLGLLCFVRGASRPVASESVSCGCPEVEINVEVKVK